ncbi:AbgT family transporter [Gloeobacter morelensis]|uniref:AbgT family transporter n=1 Tax=Gloeobacter morelensis MG652769 TaxID=2781736 RepID=A0ABY3PIS6_9CYAN|nr:AbgT family transporter [Gloeobacter morelensis]UFP93518.1 AbgT family transporter [Gloeobacter morelensis MG652769]
MTRDPSAEPPLVELPPPAGWVGRFLNRVEAVGNRLPDPLTLFALFALAMPALSWLAVQSGWSVVHPVSGKTIEAVNLLTSEGIRRMLTEAIANFTGFPPLGIVLVVLLGIGVAERSGLIAALLTLSVTAVPRALVTPTLVFTGVNASVAADAGFVVLIPLGAALYLGLGRHPLAGLCAAFAGVSGGFSANLLITSLDPLLAGFTQSAAQLFDPAYQVAPTANYYFMVASVFLLTGLGWFVTERIVEPRLGVWRRPTGFPDLPSADLSARERRAAWIALASFVVILAVFAWQGLAPGGLLHGENGDLKPLFQSLIPIIAIAFLVPGLIYGALTGSIRDDRAVATMMAETMATMGSYIVLAFAAAQFIAYFNWSNLGIMVAIAGANFLKGIGLTGIALLLLFILFAALLDLFIASASAKWAVMAPIFVPMLMGLGYSPELTQAAYRVADSFTNVIAPLLPYFPLIVVFARKYEPDLRLGSLLAAMLPYSIAFGLGWSGLFVLWYLFNLPLGPGAPLLYIPR